MVLQGGSVTPGGHPGTANQARINVMSAPPVPGRAA